VLAEPEVLVPVLALVPVPLEPDADEDAVELPLVLVGVLKLELDDGVADMLERELLLDESVLELVGLKTPLLKVNDEEVVEVAFLRQDSGIVKQQGRPVLVGRGLKTPS